MFWYIIIGMYIGAFLGTITMGLFMNSAVETEAEKVIKRFFDRERYMQYLWKLSKEVEDDIKNKGRKRLMEEYHEMLGSKRSVRLSQEEIDS